MKLFRYAFWGILFFSATFAQNFNVNLIAHIDDYPTAGYSDCWGYSAPDGREYALLGVNAGVSIVDVTDTSHIAEVDFVPFVNFSWYDMKVFQNYMYVTSEGTTDMLIVDLSTLPDSASIVGTYGGFSSEPHNNFIDTETGILYGIEDFNFTPAVRVISLLFPENPFELSTIGTTNNGADVHDVFAQDSVLYIAEGSSGSIGIFDMSNPTNPSLIVRQGVPSPGYVHNVWVSEDNRYMVTTEETPEKTVKIWDIQDLQNITLLSEYLGASELAHNAFIKDEYIFLSHYQSGLKIVDIADPANPVEVGSYDTYPQGEGPDFNGAWGVYPFTRNGLIFVSNIESGLYVLTFDSVRAGGVEGTVSDVQTGLPIPGAEIRFEEAGKTIESDSNGYYSLRTFEGSHTLIFSQPGYFSDTVSVTLPAGPNIIRDVSLDPNFADIDLSVDSILITLPVNTTGSAEFIIRNVGPSGRLDYTLDDVNGPVPTMHPLITPEPREINLRFDTDISALPRVEQPYFNNSEDLVGDTIIIDPAGDAVGSGLGDLIHVFAVQGASEVTFEFEFLNPVDRDSTFLLFSLDTDFDVNTGAFPGGFGINLPAQDIGAEYDILINIPAIPVIGAPPLTASIWIGANTGPSAPPIYTGSVSVNANIVTLTVPLSVIGNDDGNMAAAGLGGHLDPATVFATSVDWIPDVGHGVVGVNPLGDLPWLSLSQESGSILAGQADTLTVSFDTQGLEPNSTFSGVILINSNDPDESVLTVPVTLVTEAVLGIGDAPLTPGIFTLNQNYPNPFNPSTLLSYQLPVTSKVKLSVYNLLGQKVRVLVKQHQPAGIHQVEWDGRDQTGVPVATGVYFYRLEAVPLSGSGQRLTKTRNMILMR